MRRPDGSKGSERYDIVTAVVHFDLTIRTIIDGRKVGFASSLSIARPPRY